MHHEHIEGRVFPDMDLGMEAPVEGTGGSDWFHGGPGVDRLEGREPSLPSYVRHYFGDTVDYTESPQGVNVDLDDQDDVFEAQLGVVVNVSHGWAEGDQLEGFENAVGSRYNDNLVGDRGANKLFGGLGNDFLFGHYGDDMLWGDHDGGSHQYPHAGHDDAGDDHGEDDHGHDHGHDEDDDGGHADHGAMLHFEDVENGGHDYLWGGPGNDTLEGGMGADVIAGGFFEPVTPAPGETSTSVHNDEDAQGNQGIDTASYARSNEGVVVNLSDEKVTVNLSGEKVTVMPGTGLGGHAEGDELYGIEKLHGSAYPDMLIGDSEKNELRGSGNIYESATGSGRDKDGKVVDPDQWDVFASQFRLTDALMAMDHDTLIGGGGDDALFGLHGDDELMGGMGNDMLMAAWATTSWMAATAWTGCTATPATTCSRAAWATTCSWATPAWTSCTATPATTRPWAVWATTRSWATPARTSCTATPATTGSTAAWATTSSWATPAWTGSSAATATIRYGAVRAMTYSGAPMARTWSSEAWAAIRSRAARGADVLNGDGGGVSTPDSGPARGMPHYPHYHGGDGHHIDEASYTGSRDTDGDGKGVTVNLMDGTGQGDDAEGDVLYKGTIENLRGSVLDDMLTGDDRANIIWGEAGDDTIKGGGGNDWIVGGLDDDTLYGQDGGDRFVSF